MYIKTTLSTSTDILYASRNRHSLNATVQLYAHYSTVWLAILIGYTARYTDWLELYHQLDLIHGNWALDVIKKKF